MEKSVLQLGVVGAHSRHVGYQTLKNTMDPRAHPGARMRLFRACLPLSELVQVLRVVKLDTADLGDKSRN